MNRGTDKAQLKGFASRTNPSLRGPQDPHRKGVFKVLGLEILRGHLAVRWTMDRLRVETFSGFTVAAVRILARGRESAMTH